MERRHEDADMADTTKLTKDAIILTLQDYYLDTFLYSNDEDL